MRRRQLLVSAGVAALAGCSTGSENGDPTSTSPETTVPSQPAATVQSEELAVQTVAQRELACATGEVENTGDSQIGAINLTAEFLDADGSVVTTGVATIRALAPGEVWEPWIQSTESADAIDSISLRVSGLIGLTRTYMPSQFEIESQEIRIPEGESASTRVVGEIRNTGSRVPYADVRPKVYAENGNVMTTGIDSISPFRPGRVWAFDAVTHLFNPSWKDRIDTYEIVVTS
jgi:hypothetical protein